MELCGSHSENFKFMKTCDHLLTFQSVCIIPIFTSFVMRKHSHPWVFNVMLYECWCHHKPPPNGLIIAYINKLTRIYCLCTLMFLSKWVEEKKGQEKASLIFDF